jgi:hypothetical protein
VCKLSFPHPVLSEKYSYFYCKNWHKKWKSLQRFHSNQIRIKKKEKNDLKFNYVYISLISFVQIFTFKALHSIFERFSILCLYVFMPLHVSGVLLENQYKDKPALYFRFSLFWHNTTCSLMLFVKEIHSFGRTFPKSK